MSIIASIEDADISAYDLSLLSNENWLNDRIIYFCFKLYEKKILSSSSQFVKFKFFDPILVSFLCSEYFDEDDFEQSLPPASREPRWWFLPITNKENSLDNSTHWSLLIFDSVSSCFFHIDSMNGYNQTAAKLFSKTLSKFLKLPKNQYDFIPLSCPQQPNSYDCGVYCLLFALYSSSFFFSTPSADLRDSSIRLSFTSSWETYLKTSFQTRGSREERERLKEEISLFLDSLH